MDLGPLTRRAREALITGVAVILVNAEITGASLAGPNDARPTPKIAVQRIVKDEQTVRVRADFPTGVHGGERFGRHPRLQLQRSFTRRGQFVAVGGPKRSRAAGVSTFRYRLDTRAVWLRVCNDPRRPNSRHCTSAIKVRPADTSTPSSPDIPVTVEEPGEVVLEPPASASQFTAVFTGGAAVSGRQAVLQVEPIVTTLTRDVVATGQWREIASATQSVIDGLGTAVFSVPDPLEIPHRYRVVTGDTTQYVSNEVTTAADSGAKGTGLPQVYLNTNEADPIVSKTRYIEARFAASASSEYPECLSVDERLAAVRGRGNSTWTWAKKPYNVKLDKKADLCGLGKSKKWTLLANHFDRSLLRNTAASYVGRQLAGLAWTPDGRPVDLWLNGDYRGSYLLIERIAAEPGNRLPYAPAEDNRDYGSADTAPATPGFLLEWDFRAGGDRNIVTDSGIVAIKDPEDDYDEAGVNTGEGITQAQVDYISEYVNACDHKNFGAGQWRTCIDPESAVDHYLAMELLRSVDGNMATSVYMWKPANDRLRLGPLWDFDIAAGSAVHNGIYSPTGWALREPRPGASKSWFNRLNDDPEFRDMVQARWPEVRDQVSGVLPFLDIESQRIRASASENYQLWNVNESLWPGQILQGSWTAEVEYLRNWLATRIEWMDEQLCPQSCSPSPNP